MAGGNEKVNADNMTAESTQDTKKARDKKKKSKDATIVSVTNALKELSPEQQVSTLLTKYTELAEENQRLQTSCRSFERIAQQAQKDKDRVEHEHGKAILTRSRLESLCRELQRQNKLIKEENLSRLKEEEERRKEVSNQFNTTLSEISQMMEENTTKNSKLREENQGMASRLKELIKQTEQREDHVEKIIKQKELEAQLAEARLAKFHIEFAEEKEKMLEDKKSLLEDISKYQAKLQEKSMCEISLRTQLNSYTEKYEEFQGTLDKSNEIFKNFKKEMEDMSKTIKRHEKETKMWREKADSASKALLQMFNERTKMEGKIESLNKQNGQLQSLCRALQQQVAELRTQLRTQGIREISPVPSQMTPRQYLPKEPSPIHNCNSAPSSSPSCHLSSTSTQASCIVAASDVSVQSSSYSQQEITPMPSPPCPESVIAQRDNDAEVDDVPPHSPPPRDEPELDMEAVD